MAKDKQTRYGERTNALFKVLTNKRAMVPLLMLALLLCHGAFGAMHMISSCEACDPSEVATHHPAAQQAVGDTSEPGTGGAPAADLEHPEYFAIVLAFLSAAVLKVLLGRARKPIKPAFLRSFRPLYTPVANSLSWGSSPPLLQVFRL